MAEALMQRLLQTAVSSGGPDAAAKVLLDAVFTDDALAPYVDFDYPRTDDYGRVLAAECDGFELLVMSWRPGDLSAIHDHGRASWGVMRTLGRATHESFHIEDGHLHSQGTRALRPDVVVRIDGTLIHQVGNPGPDPLVTVHLYAAPPTGAGVTDGTRLYDLSRGTVLETNGPAFLCPSEAHPIGVIAADRALTDRFQAWIARRRGLR